jgi:hypothetical protein
MELTTTTLAIFATVAAMGLVGVVAIEVILISEEAEALGCRTSPAFNAIKGRCFRF